MVPSILREVQRRPHVEHAKRSAGETVPRCYATVTTTAITKAHFDTAKQFITGDIRREVELAKAWHDPLRKPRCELEAE